MAVGRTPQPAKLKLINGRSEGRDSGGRVVDEPPPFERKAPKAPMWLPAEARAEWNRVVPDLDNLGLLKTIDGAALTAYCMAWQRFFDASAIVAREGMVVVDRQGKQQRHPALLTAEAASKELRAWCSEFGLTPSAESRLGAKGDDGDKGENPFAGTG